MTLAEQEEDIMAGYSVKQRGSSALQTMGVYFLIKHVVVES